MQKEQEQQIIFLRLPAVLDRVGVKKTKLYGMVKAGEFPKPTKLRGVAVWPDHVVRDWQLSQINAPQGEA